MQVFLEFEKLIDCYTLLEYLANNYLGHVEANLLLFLLVKLNEQLKLIMSVGCFAKEKCQGSRGVKRGAKGRGGVVTLIWN